MKPATSKYIEMKILILLLVAGNIFDAASTLYILETGKGREINPIMAYMYELGIGAFLFFKLTAVLVGSFVLWKHRKQQIARVAAWFLTVAYGVLSFYHGIMLILVHL